MTSVCLTWPDYLGTIPTAYCVSIDTASLGWTELADQPTDSGLGWRGIDYHLIADVGFFGFYLRSTEYVWLLKTRPDGPAASYYFESFPTLLINISYSVCLPIPSMEYFSLSSSRQVRQVLSFSNSIWCSRSLLEVYFIFFLYHLIRSIFWHTCPTFPPPPPQPPTPQPPLFYPYNHGR